jgi:hypothetical protein
VMPTGGSSADAGPGTATSAANIRTAAHARTPRVMSPSPVSIE